VTAAKAKKPRTKKSTKRTPSFGAKTSRTDGQPSGWVYRSDSAQETAPSTDAPAPPAGSRKAAAKTTRTRKTTTRKKTARKTGTKKQIAAKVPQRKRAVTRPAPARPSRPRGPASSPATAPPRGDALTNALDWITAPIAYALVGALALLSRPSRGPGRLED
jgi:hypothetical protein